VGPYAVIGEHVRIGRDCRIGASTVIDGHTEIGDGNEIFPMTSIGLVPQDLKFGGEPTRVTIGDRNVIREFVTIHRGTAGGGGLTSIGTRNLLMAYTHIAHDCHIGNNTIFGNAATLAGHVTVDDFANVGAFSGVHQFCRVGKYAFIGGYSVVTKDALPYVKTVGNRARIYGINTIGLRRRGFAQETITKLHRAYRVLAHSATSRAIAQIERLVEQSNGGFGAYLQLAHDWAAPAARLRSYELFARHVAPHFQGQHQATADAKARARAARPALAENNLKAVAQSTARYQAELDANRGRYLASLRTAGIRAGALRRGTRPTTIGW